MGKAGLFFISEGKFPYQNLSLVREKRGEAYRELTPQGRGRPGEQGLGLGVQEISHLKAVYRLSFAWGGPCVSQQLCSLQSPRLGKPGLRGSGCRAELILK